MLILAIFVIVLLLVSVPTIIMLNQSSSRGQVTHLRNVKSGAAAVSGIMHAAQQLATIWPQGLAGNFAGTDCNSQPIPMSSGTSLRLVCAPVGRPYEVRVVATATPAATSATAQTSRSVEAYLSLRTVAVKLSTGYSASAALLLVNPPSVVDPLNTPRPISVHWGPVVCLSSATQPAWVLYDPMDAVDLMVGRVQGFPRKFSLGGITGYQSVAGESHYRVPDWTFTAARSDGVEFWAFAPFNFPPLLNDSLYKTLAQSTDPGVNIHATRTGPGPATPVSGGFFDIPGDTLTFDSSFQPAPNSIIYVNGNVILKDSQIDLSTGGALIVTENLTLGSMAAGSGIASKSLNVPPTAPLEYPYFSPTDRWPCRSEAASGQPCTPGVTADSDILFAPTFRLNFRGFVWAKQTLNVTDWWNMAGVIVSGDPSSGTGHLIVQPGTALTLAYDDLVNHNIMMNTTELQVDSMRDIATP